MKATNKSIAIKAAQRILKEHGVKAPPVQVERIIKAYGLLLEYSPLEDEISGMAYIKDGTGIIGINSLHHPNRQRFSVAHELAHHILHADELRKAVHVDKAIFRNEESSKATDPLEIQANAFAAELLVPREFLMTVVGTTPIDLEDDAKVESLARRFRVSPSMMRLRLAGHLS